MKMTRTPQSRLYVTSKWNGCNVQDLWQHERETRATFKKTRHEIGTQEEQKTIGGCSIAACCISNVELQQLPMLQPQISFFVLLVFLPLLVFIFHRPEAV
jgi:hypothetical protein